MKKFIGRFLVFLLPFFAAGCVVAWFCYIGFKVGELRDFNELIEAQRNDHSVFIGMGYNEQTSYYKLVNAQYYQADVIALGTSRVMQFKNDYFSAGFYNCGGAVGRNYDEYLNFLENLNYKPEIIIVGLDAWVFNDAWNSGYPVLEDYMPVMMIERDKKLMIRSMVEDFIDRKWDWTSLQNYNMNYGFNGRIKDSGFQWDGSYYYGNVYREPKLQDDYMFADTFARIDGGYGRFEWGNHIDEETCGCLGKFLGYCRDNDIEVIGFAPPFAPGVYERMASSGNYGYLSEISPACRELFGKYGYMYFDYMDASGLRVDDTYFVDGFHGSEVVYARIIQDMVGKGSCIREYVDEDRLMSLLENRVSNLMMEDFVH